jgi:hypothetical protein
MNLASGIEIERRATVGERMAILVGAISGWVGGSWAQTQFHSKVGSDALRVVENF